MPGNDAVKAIGIISDTHGHAEFTQAAVLMFEQLEVDAVVHCGDIGSRKITQLLQPWPTHYVLGNCDDPDDAWEEWIEESSGKFHGFFADIRFGNRRVAVSHGHHPSLLQAAVESQKYDLVCSGHTHQTHREEIGQTWTFNPGAIYRTPRRSVGYYELTTGKPEVIYLE